MSALVQYSLIWFGIYLVCSRAMVRNPGFAANPSVRGTYIPQDLPDWASPGRDGQIPGMGAYPGGPATGELLARHSLGAEQAYPVRQNLGGIMNTRAYKAAVFADHMDFVKHSPEEPHAEQFNGGDAMMLSQGVTAQDLTPSYVTNLVGKLFRRFKCEELDLGGKHCESCLTGSDIFRMLGVRSSHLDSGQLEQAAVLALYFASDLDETCKYSAVARPFRFYQDELGMMLYDGTGIGTKSTPVANAATVSSFLMGLMSHYEADEVKDKLEDLIDDMEDEYDDDDFGNDSPQELFKEQCISGQKLLDEAGYDEDDVIPGNKMQEIAARLMLHIIDGDMIDDDCRLLPDKNFFVDNIFDSLSSEDPAMITQEDFRRIADTLGLGDPLPPPVKAEDVLLFPAGMSGYSEGVLSDYVESGPFASIVKRSVDIVPLSTKHKRVRRQAVKRRKVSSTTWKYSKNQRCFSNRQILSIFHEYDTPGISKASFTHMCPALLQQQMHGVCRSARPPPPRDGQRFGYGTLAVIIMCLCTLIGIILLPCTSRSSYDIITAAILGLAVGTLLSAAFMLLVPKAYGFHSHEHYPGGSRLRIRPFWFGMIVLLGVYVLSLLETIIVFVRRPKKDRNAGYIEADDSQTVDLPKEKKETPASKPVGLKGMSAKEIKGKLTERAITGFPSVGMLIILTEVIIHFATGLSIGAAFTHTVRMGAITSLAAIVHVLLRSLGHFGVLVQVKINPFQALAVLFFSSLAAFLGLYVGLAIDADPLARQWIFALSAGMFVYVSLALTKKLACPSGYICSGVEVAAIVWQCGIKAIIQLPLLTKDVNSARFTSYLVVQNIGMIVGFVIIALVAGLEDLLHR